MFHKLGSRPLVKNLEILNDQYPVSGRVAAAANWTFVIGHWTLDIGIAMREFAPGQPKGSPGTKARKKWRAGTAGQAGCHCWLAQQCEVGTKVILLAKELEGA